MVVINMDFVGYNAALNTMTVNGNPVKIIKNKDGSRNCSVEVEEGKTEIVVFKSHFYTGKYWFWWNLMCFMISFFGLFDVRVDKKFLVVEYKAVLDITKDTNISINVADFENGGKFVDLVTEAPMEVVANKQYFDKEAKKKHAKMKKAKWAVFIACAAITTVLILVL